MFSELWGKFVHVCDVVENANFQSKFTQELDNQDVVGLLVNWIDGGLVGSCEAIRITSLTLRVIAVDPDKSLPCHAVPCVFWTVLFSIGT